MVLSRRCFTSLIWFVYSLLEHNPSGLIDLKVQKGSASARADDTKSLKGAVLDWIMPRGGSLVLPLARNVKFDQGFHHDRTGALLCPTNLNWSDSE